MTNGQRDQGSYPTQDLGVGGYGDSARGIRGGDTRVHPAIDGARHRDTGGQRRVPKRRHVPVAARWLGAWGAAAVGGVAFFIAQYAALPEMGLRALSAITFGVAYAAAFSGAILIRLTWGWWEGR